MSRIRAPKLHVVVTGAAGQLGEHVLARLIADRGVGRIVSLDLVPPAAVSKKLEHHEVDVRAPDLGRFLEGADVLIHLAFVVTSYLERRIFDDINVGGSKNVFTQAARSGVKKLIYTSSIAAYGVRDGHPGPLLEGSPRVRVDDFPYSAAKHEVEAFLDGFEAEHPELAVVRVRPSVLIGARLNNPLARLFGRQMDRGIVPVMAEAPMPVVWDEDVADLLALCWQKDARGAYNANAEPPVDLAAFAKARGLRVLRLPPAASLALVKLAPLMKRLGGTEPIDPAWHKHGQVRMNSSSARAKAELGWAPSCPTGEAVMARYLEVARGPLDPRIAAFLGLVALAGKSEPRDPELAGMRSSIYLKITGKGGGDFGIRVVDLKAVLSRGVPRSPTSICTLSADTMRRLIAGQITYASAQMTGKVRIEGDTASAFALPGMIARFRLKSERPGALGRVLRAYVRWVEQGSHP